LAVWDGDQFVYESDSDGWEWWNLAKLFWRYGRAPYKTDRLMQKTVATFLKMYEKPWFPFRSLTQRAFELDLTQVTAQTGQEYLRANGISEMYANDIVQASTRVNYASNLGDIHGLETMIAMAVQGAKQIVGGNWRIFKGMIDESGASLLLNTSLTSIDLEDIRHPTLPHERFTLKTIASKPEIGAPASYPITFDKVILATPWQFADIVASDDVMQHPIDEVPYIKLHVTLFTSAYLISPSIYRWAPVSKVPSTILTTLADSDDRSPGGSREGKAGFYSIQTRGMVTNPKTGREEFLYHIFSPTKVTSDFLSTMLGVKIPESFTRPANDTDGADASRLEPITWYHAHVFHSYPRASPRVTFQDPIIRAGLYYTSGMESFISYMETSALMGMNVARLLIDDLVEETSASDGASSADIMDRKDEQAVLAGAKKEGSVDELSCVGAGVDYCGSGSAGALA
jgi:prenylcysteine oxidase / farnesylcysteine lyase